MTSKEDNWSPKLYLATPEGLKGSDGVIIPYLFQQSKKYYCISDGDLKYLLEGFLKKKAN